MMMTKEQLDRAQALFDAALDMDPAARSSYLERECDTDTELRAYVLRLLAAHEYGDRTIQHAVGAAAHEWSRHDASGRRLGSYTLLEELGSGGMGTVWLAQRADDAYQARVAIKLIRGGFANAELDRRFRVERQILADLAHPGIARLLDGGDTADGTPFIVMEYINGKPITTYAAEQRLEVRARLDLFLRVCDAVQHAHASLVIHRDIKPANILVGTDGVPKLVDFGIAKPLTADAASATTMIDRRLTLSYASPEQVRGERITTATDVFSLGVLLYELLTEEQPFASGDTSPVEIQRRVLEVDPAPPSVVARQRGAHGIARDLDTIIARAMRKEPEQRYASVEQLADDIGRQLAGLPIRAVPPSMLYHARRFIQRNRIGVAAAALALMLAAGSIGFHTVRVTRERDTARAERETSDRVAQFMVDLFQYVDPEAARGKTITAAELLHAAAEQLDTALHDQPRVRARLLLNVADVYSNIGMRDAALPLIDDVIATKRSMGGRPDLELVRAIYLRTRGGRGGWEQVLAIADSVGPPARQYSLLARGALARSIAEAGELDRALAIMNEVMAGATELESEYADGIAEAEVQMGAMLNARNRFGEAEPYLASSLARRRKHLGDDEPRTLYVMDELSITLNALGRYRESEALTRERLGHVRRIAPENSTAIARTLMSLSSDARNLGQPVQAESLAIEAFAIVRERAPNSASAGFIVRMLGLAQAEQARLADAESTLREALRIHEAALGPGHLVTARVLVDVAGVRRDRGDLGEALQLIQRALETARQQTGVESMQYAAHEESLARLRLRMGDIAQADSLIESALPKLQALLPAGHPIIATVLETRAEVALAKGEAEAAAADARAAIRSRETAMPENRALLGEARSVLGASLLRLDQDREALETLTRAHRDLLEVRGPDHPTTVLAARRLRAARAAAGS